MPRAPTHKGINLGKKSLKRNIEKPVDIYIYIFRNKNNVDLLNHRILHKCLQSVEESNKKEKTN